LKGVALGNPFFLMCITRPAFRSKSSLANAQALRCSCGLSTTIGAILDGAVLRKNVFYSYTNTWQMSTNWKNLFKHWM